ncbi:hypothetical protein [Tolumonas lignilytica]|jgi:hypothetical protein|uniref:hypothetical protein n=1 Tax=Tolumonas lignilytica TaxID=1283284 RepID=UPI0004669444|nr:hypothetical protein [Tolumonas lignilytica]
MKKMIAPAVTLFAILSLPSAFAADQSLSTNSGQELGLSVSSYKYEEPNVDVKNDGIKIGADYTTALSFQNEWFLKLNGRIAYGTVDYTGSGTAKNNPDYYYELRPLIGNDRWLGNSVLAPYAGFGFRYLYNDSRGMTSTGYWGYQRESRYYYVPVGVTHRFSLDSRSILESMVEFDYLIRGQQKSRLSDVSPSYPDADNRQNSGYGIKFSSMYRAHGLAIGPYIDYWNINDSEVSTAVSGNTIYSGFEPQNTTFEFGIKASMRF